MPAPPTKSSNEFQRLAALPPYVLATVDELKSRLRAEGPRSLRFGLGNPDGASPRAAVERLIEEAQTPGNQRYMPSRGSLKRGARSATGTRASTSRPSTPTAKRSSRWARRRGSAHLLLAIVGPGDCVLSPDPCYPIHRFGVSIAGGEPIPVADRPGTRRLRRDRDRVRALAAQAQGADRQLPAQPHQRRRRPGVLREGRRAGEARIAVGHLRPRVRGPGASTAARRPASSRSTARASWRSSSSPCRRATRCPAGASASASATARLVGALANIKGYLDYGNFAPDPAGGVDGADVVRRATSPRTAPLYKHRAGLLCDRLAAAGWPVPRRWRRCSCGRRCRRRPRTWARSASPPSCWSRRGWPCRRGSGSAPAARVSSASRWSRTDDRVRRACAAIGAIPGRRRRAAPPLQSR